MTKGLEDASPELKAQYARIALIEQEYQNDLRTGILTDKAAKEKARKAIDAQKKVIDEIKEGIAPEAANLLEDAIKGNEGSAKKIVELLGPDSEVGKAISDGLKATKDHFAHAEDNFIAETEQKQKEGWDKLTGRVGKVLGDFVGKYKEAVKKGGEELQKEDDLDEAADRHFRNQANAWETGFSNWKNKELPKQVKEYREAKEKQNKELRETVLEADAEESVEKTNKQDFYHLDKYGRQRDGIQLSKEQIKQAGQVSREYQSVGFDEQTANQAAILETINNSQMVQANKTNEMQRRYNALMGSQQMLPDVMQWGNGW